jgi:hypothetical protein
VEQAPDYLVSYDGTTNSIASSEGDYAPEDGTDFHYSIQSKFAIKLAVRARHWLG